MFIWVGVPAARSSVHCCSAARRVPQCVRARGGEVSDCRVAPDEACRSRGSRRSSAPLERRQMARRTILCCSVLYCSVTPTDCRLQAQLQPLGALEGGAQFAVMKTGRPPRRHTSVSRARIVPLGTRRASESECAAPEWSPRALLLLHLPSPPLPSRVVQLSGVLYTSCAHSSLLLLFRRHAHSELEFSSRATN